MGLGDLREGKRGPVTVVQKVEGRSWVLKGGVSLARWKGEGQFQGKRPKGPKKDRGCVSTAAAEAERQGVRAGSHNVSVFSGVGDPMLLKLLNRCQQRIGHRIG